jgi:hypothetical protein
VINARPNLNAELAALLEDDWPFDALQFVRYEMRGAPAELAAPAAEGVRRTAKYVRSRIPQLGKWDLRNETFAFETEAAVDVAWKFEGAGVDFVSPLRELLAALDATPGVRLGTQGDIGRVSLDAYLKKHR